MSQLTYKIAKLWGSGAGTVEKHVIDEELHYEDDDTINAASNFQADLMLIKLKDEISAIFSDAQIDVRFTCQLCLEDFEETIEISSTEREFFWEKQPEFENMFDVFYIDQKNMHIDLSEMIRQEIILHFPIIPVCSKGCKGLCQHCGANKNKKTCKCEDSTVGESETHKPFKDLKKAFELLEPIKQKTSKSKGLTKKTKPGAKRKSAVTKSKK